MKPLRLLLLGSLPPPAGGTTLLFEQLAKALRLRSDIAVSVVDTGAHGALSQLAALARTLTALPGIDVISLHASPPGIARAGPLLLRGGAPLVVRVFGGSIDLALTEGPARERARIALVVEGAARVLVETDHVAVWLGTNFPNARVGVLRNSRAIPATPPAPPPGAKRFAFVGQVSEAKGARELAAAMQIAAPHGVRLDVYGACSEPAMRELLTRAPGVRVRGEVANERVPALLAAADALVLPTRHAAEGHPGVILEAFAAGRAVIATQHRAIPELVAHEQNGLLVPVGDAGALAAALLRIADDRELGARLGASAFASAREFDAEVWTERFVTVCREAARP